MNNMVDILNKYNEELSHGFNKIIFSLYLFIKKLYKELEEDKQTDVFFLAREGEYLKELFDYYNKQIDGNIKSHYLYVSRKATYLPSLKSIDEEDFSYLLNQYNYISTKEFLKSLNFTEEEIADFKLKDDINNRILNYKSSKEFKNLKNNKIFKQYYEKKRIEQIKLFKKYIKEFTNKKDIAVVDIGWNGSIQDNIIKILGNDYKIKGYYFGLMLRDKRNNNLKKGLVFSNYPNMTPNYYLYSENRTIYEILCGASHGSANKYYLKNNKVEVELFEKEEEKEIYNNIVKPSQDEMFNVFKELCKNNFTDEKIFNKIEYDLFFKPTKEQIEFFDKIYHYENFGVFGFTKFKSNKIGFIQWLKEHYKFIFRYNLYIADSFWPIYTLKSFKMCLPLAYYKHKRTKLFKKSNIL